MSNEDIENDEFDEEFYNEFDDNEEMNEGGEYGEYVAPIVVEAYAVVVDVSSAGDVPCCSCWSNCCGIISS